jgi:hypothetical protein
MLTGAQVMQVRAFKGIDLDKLKINKVDGKSV